MFHQKTAPIQKIGVPTKSVGNIKQIAQKQTSNTQQTLQNGSQNPNRFVLLFSQLINLLLHKDEKTFKIITVALLIIALSNRIYTATKTSMKIINDQQQNAVIIINKYTNIDDVVVSDEEILSGISGRLPPPELSDISQVRIKSNNLSSEDFKQIISVYKPKLIIPWNGRLESIKNFKENLFNYRILTSFSSSKNIYIRIDR